MLDRVADPRHCSEMHNSIKLTPTYAIEHEIGGKVSSNVSIPVSSEVDGQKLRVTVADVVDPNNVPAFCETLVCEVAADETGATCDEYSRHAVIVNCSAPIVYLKRPL